MKRFMLALVSLVAVFASHTATAADWEFDKAHTQIKFRVKHIVTDVWGRFKEFDATISYDPQHPTLAKLEVVVDVTSIDTDNPKRDNHLRSEDFFHAERFPKMTFVSKEIRPAGEGRFILVGDLTIRGHTEEVELKVEGPTEPMPFWGSTKVAAHAEGKINRTNFGLLWNRALETGNLLVSEEVTIVIDAEFDMKADESSE